MQNLTMLIEEVNIDHSQDDLDSEILQLCEMLEIESLNDLTIDTIYELSQSNMMKHKDTSRLGLNSRRMGRFLISSIVPVGGLLVALSEGGFIPTTEKHAFIRFQGLITIHAGRLDSKLGGNAYSTGIKKIRDKFKLPENSPVAKVSQAYSEMTASSLAFVISGYYKLMEKSGASKEQLSAIKTNLVSIKMMAVKGTGVWNRIKSGVTGGLLVSVLPVISLINQFTILNNKAPKLNLLSTAQTKFKSMIK